MNLKPFISKIYVLLVGAVGVGALVALTDPGAIFDNAGPLAFFGALSLVLKRAGFHVAPIVRHSLVGVVDLAAVFVFGPALGGLVAASSAFLYLFLNAVRRGPYTLHDLFEIPFFNAGLKVGMAFASTYLYQLFGGTVAPRFFTLVTVPAFGAALLTWFALDHIGWGLVEFFQGGIGALVDFYRKIFLTSLFIEIMPLPFSIAIAVVYDTLNIGIFLMMTVGLMGTAYVVQRFADTSASLERRRNELAVLNEFGQALSLAGFDAEKVVDLLYEHAKRIVRADMYRIEVFDGSRALNSTSLLALDATDEKVQRPRLTLWLSLLRDYFVKHREPLLISDLQNQSDPSIEDIQIGEREAHSALAVPLFAGDVLIGVMSLFTARRRAYSQIHANNLASMCTEAAFAVQNARLYAAERKRALQLATVSEVSRQVAKLLDLDELLNTLVTRVKDRFGYSIVQVFTVDADQVVFRSSTHPRGAVWREMGVRLAFGQGIVGHVGKTGETLNVADVKNDPRYILDPEKALQDMRAEVALPIIGGSQVLGVLDVQSVEPNAFGNDDLYILKTLAAQLAVAVEDARLYQAQKEEAYFLNALLQVAENLAEITELGEAMETVVRITPLLIGVERCAIFLYQPEENTFAAARAYGLSAEQIERFQNARFRADNQFVFGEMVRTRMPVAIADAATSPLMDPNVARAFGIQSLLLVPFITRGEIVGAMVVDQGTRPRHFTPHEVEVVMGVANQATVAIEGARTRREAEEKKRIAYELTLARQIQTSFLPEACPVLPGYQICSLWQTAGEVSGDFYDFVTQAGGRLGMTIADVSDKGLPAAMFMALTRTILRTMTIGKPSPREAMERANDIIIADAKTEMFVTVFHGSLDPSTHRLSYVNAGHNPPLLYRANVSQVSMLPGRGIALAAMPNISLEEHEIELESGDVLLLFTDGVTDAINRDEEDFGFERLTRVIESNAHQSAEELVAHIARAVSEFVGESAQFDDLTMVAVKRVA